MGWIVVLLVVVVLAFLVRKSVDRETSRNLRLLGKVFAVFVGGLVVLLVLFFIGGH